MTRYSAGYKGPMLPAAGPRVSAQTAGTPAGTLSPRGAMTGGGRPAPTSPMKKGGAIAKKTAPKKR